MKFIPIIFSIFFTATSFAGNVKTITGSLNSNYQDIQLKITIEHVLDSELKNAKSPSQEDLQQGLSIYLLTEPSYGPQTSPISNNKQDSGTISGINTNFWWKTNTTINITSVGNGAQTTYTLTYDVTVQANPSSGSNITLKSIIDASTDKFITIDAQFNPWKNNAYDKTSSNDTRPQTKLKLAPIFASPNGVPGKITVTGAHKTLSLSWITGDVNYVPASANVTAQTPGDVLVLVFKPGTANNTTLDAYNAKGDSSVTDSNNKVSCFYTVPSASNSSCITCNSTGSDGAWISDEQNHPDIAFSDLVPNTGSATLDVKLEPEQKYYVVLQYGKGVQQSNCFLGVPIRTHSLAEANGAEDAKEADPRCFIASATFDPLNPVVNVFRWGRDYFLEPYEWGHNLVNFYYEHSQNFAELIRESFVLRIIMKVVLYPIAAALFIVKGTLNYPLISFLFFSVFLSLIFIWKRRRSFL